MMSIAFWVSKRSSCFLTFQTGCGLLGFFAQEDGLYKVFTKTADSMREEFRFGYSSAADVLEEYGYQRYRFVTLRWDAMR